MTERANLEFGQTPWDDLPREELLLTIWKMWSALTSSYSVLNQCIATEAEHPFWGIDGSGGVAFEKTKQCIDPIARPGTNDSETVYHAFFRYAVDLLFERGEHRRLFHGWTVCPKCDGMFGNSYQSLEGRPCRFPGCDGVLELLTWEHLRPDIAAYLAKEHHNAVCK